MPSSDSTAVIVARYLKANHYLESYKAFVDEAGLELDAGNIKHGDLTLETLLEEKRAFDVAVHFEKLGVSESKSTEWRRPAPEIAHNVHTLPSSSNILNVKVLNVDKHTDGTPTCTLLASTADRRLSFIDPLTLAVKCSYSQLHDSPILSFSMAGEQHLLTSSMSGQLYRSDLSGRVLEKRRDHSKYVVQIATYDEPATSNRYVASAGWDAKILVYKLSIDQIVAPGSRELLGSPVATLTLSTKPEAITFLSHPDTNKPVLLLSRTDSSLLFYYALDQDSASAQLRLIGQQNLAPHSNSWIAFTPSAFQISPVDPTILAVAASTVPHMKLLIVRMMFPPWEARSGHTESASAEAGGVETQASQARAALALADREAAAIQIHCNTMAPQTAYSTPAVAWRPDGSGVWVNGDDGVIRGIEAQTGKVVATLAGHEPGTKVRCLWAGWIDEPHDTRQEVLISGGFDQRLIVWRVKG